MQRMWPLDLGHSVAHVNNALKHKWLEYDAGSETYHARLSLTRQAARCGAHVLLNLVSNVSR